MNVNYDFSNSSLTTIIPQPSSHSSIIGYVTAIISGFLYGVNFIPVKNYETGDGMFFQWIFGSAILIGSFITHSVLGYPEFQPFAILGGVLWAAGNVCSVPIIKRIGIGLGLMIWGSTSIIVGWATTRFGLFGLIPQVPNNPALNYAGFFLILGSPIFSALVKPTVAKIPTEILIQDETVTENLPNNDEENSAGLNDDDSKIIDISFNQQDTKWNRWKDRILGILMGVFAGVCYGLMFIPVTYVKNHVHGASQNDIDYLFAQCCGIYLMSTLVLLIYCFIKRNKPEIYPTSVLPSALSGTLWFLAYLCFFIANSRLDVVISQPINASLSSIISILVGTVIYREIKGRQNYIFVVLALVFSISGVTLTALSK